MVWRLPSGETKTIAPSATSGWTLLTPRARHPKDSRGGCGNECVGTKKGSSVGCNKVSLWFRWTCTISYSSVSSPSTLRRFKKGCDEFSQMELPFPILTTAQLLARYVDAILEQQRRMRWYSLCDNQQTSPQLELQFWTRREKCNCFLWYFGCEVQKKLKNVVWKATNTCTLLICYASTLKSYKKQHHYVFSSTMAVKITYTN